jgi:hypothetical protein
VSGWSVGGGLEDVQRELFEVVGERRCLWVDRRVGHGELRRVAGRACRLLRKKAASAVRYSMHFDAEAIGGETAGDSSGVGRRRR